MSATSQAVNEFLANLVGAQQFDPSLGMNEQVAFDFDMMGNPIRNMERRALNYRFS